MMISGTWISDILGRFCRVVVWRISDWHWNSSNIWFVQPSLAVPGTPFWSSSLTSHTLKRFRGKYDDGMYLGYHQWSRPKLIVQDTQIISYTGYTKYFLPSCVMFDRIIWFLLQRWVFSVEWNSLDIVGFTLSALLLSKTESCNLKAWTGVKCYNAHDCYGTGDRTKPNIT